MKTKVFYIVLLVVIVTQMIYPTVSFINNPPEHLVQRYEWIDNDIYYFVNLYSEQTSLPEELVLAVIQAESEGKRTALSYAGAIGYMQVMPFHYPDNPDKLYETHCNIMMGIHYLSKCYELANGDIIEALKNYNAGPRSKFYNMPYIRKIMKNYLETAAVLI